MYIVPPPLPYSSCLLNWQGQQRKGQTLDSSPCTALATDEVLGWALASVALPVKWDQHKDFPHKVVASMKVKKPFVRCHSQQKVFFKKKYVTKASINLPSSIFIKISPGPGLLYFYIHCDTLSPFCWEVLLIITVFPSQEISFPRATPQWQLRFLSLKRQTYFLHHLGLLSYALQALPWVLLPLAAISSFSPEQSILPLQGCQFWAWKFLRIWLGWRARFEKESDFIKV